jgi:hypothetical protein
MASRKSPREIQDIASICTIEGIFLKHNLETQPKKTPGNKKIQRKQDSEIEKAFEMQEKGVKNAFKLF